MTLDRDKLAKILGLLSSDKSGEIVSAAQAAVVLIRNASTSWAEVPWWSSMMLGTGQA